MSFPTPTLPILFDALLAGFNGLDIGGPTLTAGIDYDDVSLVPDDRLPYLLFDIGTFKTSPWQGWQESVTWDIPATLRVIGSADNVDRVILDALQAIMQRTAELIGLPVDEDGKVTPYTRKTARLFDDGKLAFLAERGAPFLTSASSPTSVGNYAQSSLVFHIEATIDLDPRGELPVARMAVLGIVPVAPGLGGLAADSTLPDPYGIPVVASSDLIGYSAFGSRATDAERLGRSAKYVSGPDPGSQIAAVLVTPYTASISAGAPTTQLTAIARYQNWRTAYVTQQASWTSDAPSVATVNGNGLVTRIGAGTANISCIFGGATSNAAVITST